MLVLLRKQIRIQKLKNWKIEKKLTDHNHEKYITTPEFNTLDADILNARSTKESLVTKTDFDISVSSLDSKIAGNKTKNESIENKLNKLKTFGFKPF